MSVEGKTQTGGSGSAKPFRRRRTRVASDKRIADDEFMAAAIGDVEWLRQSLREANGEINYDKNGLTALHLAAIHGRIECLKLLIEKYKFDINLASSTGWRAIHLCISNQTGKRAVTCLKYLLDKKADSSVANDDGITPLHQAASEGHVQCLKMLIEVQAKIDGEDCRGHTPLDLAKLWGHRRCARIIAAEMWIQGKDHVAREMQQLQKLKMQQVLREMELEAEFKATHETYSEEAFKEWLEKRKLQEAPTEPKGRDRERWDIGRGGKDVKKPSNQREPLMKPNSIASQKSITTRRADTIPSYRSSRDQSPLSRKTTNLTQIAEDEDTGLYENYRTVKSAEVSDQRAKSPSFRNPNKWKIPLRVDDPPYVTNLTDDYPRDEYTMMPRVESAPKYFDGHHGPRLYKNDLKDSDIDTKAKLRKPDLPKETIDKVLSKDPTVRERPVVFKPRHISDVRTKKKYGDDIKGKCEVPLHLCDDMSSFLFKNSLKSATTILGEVGGGHSGSTTTASKSPLMTALGTPRSKGSANWISARFPREKVINTLRSMGKPNSFPNIKGEEYDIRNPMAV